VKLEGNGWLVAALGILLGAGALTGWFAFQSPTQPSNGAMNHEEALPSGTQLEVRCRQGAFLEASQIINSVTDIATNLPSSALERTRGELDAILYTALKQARAEVHCVTGGLPEGYEQSFADILRRGTDLARMRGLSKDVVDLGATTVELLERNQPTPQTR
jgi:hypothetical protein